MMRKLLLFLNLILLVGCSSEDPDPSILLNDSKTTYQVGFRADETVELEFTSTTSWIIAKVPEGLNISMTSGKKGTHKLVVKTTAANSTNETKKHTFTITGAYDDKQDQKTITIEQIPAFELSKRTYKIDAAGGDATVVFKFNGEQNELNNLFGYYWNDEYMGELMFREIVTRSSGYYSAPIKVNPNETLETRYATIKLVLFKKNSENEILAETDEIYIVQTGIGYEEHSPNYDLDGKVEMFQCHSLGGGIPIVLTGDGFMDTQIVDGTFGRTMEQAYKYLFSVEPMKSLKEYFDVYSVTAVSEDDYFTPESKTAFGCVTTDNSTYIAADTAQVSKYVQKIDDPLLAMANFQSSFRKKNMLVVVVLNIDKYAGTCYVSAQSPINGIPVGCSIAFVPRAIPEHHQGVGMENLIHHEAIGHGFGKLDDEYAYPENGYITDDELTKLKTFQSLGCYMNTDTQSDVAKSHWSRLASDSRFSSERLSCYEGSHTFPKGVYRPTQTSIMNNNTGGFNAPSREAIYKRVMMLANQGEYTYNFNEFVDFDKPTWSTYGNTRSVSPWQESKKHNLPPLARPRVIYED